ncbi:MAG: hypothetical protein ABSB89_09295 [Candidatus Bathyarchaeia archaeon]|jgi:hypothetical protein
MTDKSSRRKASKKNKWLLVSAIVIFLVLISALAAYSYINQMDKKPVIYPSSTYFAISDLAGTFQTTGIAYNGTGTPPASVLVNELAFNFTPVGGDADNVRIFMPGMTDPEQTWWITPIKNGTSTYSGEIQLGSPVEVQREADGTYNFPIRIAADEANGTVILNFDPNANTPGYNFVWVGQRSV